MRRRHVVELVGPFNDGSFGAKHKRVFTSRLSAEKHAERLNERHCGVTRYQSTRLVPWVEISDRVLGTCVELDRPLVQSVGERGVW